MSASRRDNGTRSLDDLLRTNRDQFEKLFSEQLRDAGAAGLRREQQPAPIAPGASSGAGSRGSEPSIDEELTRRFGRDWVAETVETQVTGGRLSALCRLTVDGRSALEFGDAPVDDDEDRAFAAARYEALEKCADALARLPKGAPPVGDRTPAARPPGNRPAGNRPAGDRAAPGSSGVLSPLTLDLIEAGLRQGRREMGIALARSALSATVSQKHAESPTVTDARGQALVGKPVGAIAELLRDHRHDLQPGDIFLQSDPYESGATHLNNWTVFAPVFDGSEIVGCSAVSANMADVGGPVHGSMPNAASTVFGEGLRIPPVRIFDRGAANAAALDIILGNTRFPETNHGDLLALVGAVQAGEQVLLDLHRRFGAGVLKRAGAAMLERTNDAMRNLIRQHLPEEPKSFEDVVDSDGLGNGPFRLKLAVWREGDQAFFDWTGTADQAEGPINMNLQDAAFATLAGDFLIKTFDPEIAMNEGFQDLFHVTIPTGSLLRPAFPAALGAQAHTLARVYDVLNGVFAKISPETARAAGYGSSPLLIFANDGRGGAPFHLTDRVFGGTPARAGGDGTDGQSLSSGTKSRPTEQLENDYPLRVERCRLVQDSGGAGAHRGGNGIEKTYQFLTAGTVSLRDDRHESRPWGVAGGKPGQGSSKTLIRADGSRETLASKVDAVKVAPGDRLIFRTAGGGGWGRPQDRDIAKVQRDIELQLVSTKAARDQYAVAVDNGRIDMKATRDLRESQGRSRRPPEPFDFGDRTRNGR